MRSGKTCLQWKPIRNENRNLNRNLADQIFSFHFVPPLEVWHCKNMQSILCCIFGPRSTLQTSSSKITMVFILQICLLSILHPVSWNMGLDGRYKYKPYSLSAEAILIHINASYFPPVPTRNSLNYVNSILWQEAFRFIIHYP